MQVPASKATEGTAMMQLAMHQVKVNVKYEHSTAASSQAQHLHPCTDQAGNPQWHRMMRLQSICMKMRMKRLRNKVAPRRALGYAIVASGVITPLCFTAVFEHICRIVAEAWTLSLVAFAALSFSTCLDIEIMLLSAALV